MRSSPCWVVIFVGSVIAQRFYLRALHQEHRFLRLVSMRSSCELFARAARPNAASSLLSTSTTFRWDRGRLPTRRGRLGKDRNPACLVFSRVFIVRGITSISSIQGLIPNNGGANARRGVSPVCGGCVRPRCGDFLDRDWVAGAILRQRCCGSRRAVWAPLAQRASATASTRPRVQPTQRNDRNFARTGRLPRERATRTLLIRSTASWTPA